MLSIYPDARMYPSRIYFNVNTSNLEKQVGFNRRKPTYYPFNNDFFQYIAPASVQTRRSWRIFHYDSKILAADNASTVCFIFSQIETIGSVSPRHICFHFPVLDLILPLAQTPGRIDHATYVNVSDTNEWSVQQ